MLKIFLFVVGIASTFAAEDDDSFSIGLGVLSPSYSQTVGKENVRVKFDQKEDGGFSYSVGDPQTGSNTYQSFGPSAQSSGYAGSAGYAGYQAPASNAGYQAPASGGYAGYQAPSSGGYAGYQAPASGGNSGYQAPASGGYNYNQAARKPEENPNEILPAGFSYHATEGQSFLNGMARKPADESNGGFMPAGFSYHATDGQSYLREGGRGGPNFMVKDESKESTVGLAQQSFQRQSQQGGRGLQDGLVGYGQGGQRGGGLQIGGYAGPQYQGAYEEHGGHA